MVLVRSSATSGIRSHYYSFKVFARFLLAKSTLLPQPVTDDQIRKKFDFNEEITSKMQRFVRLRHR